MEPPKYQTVVFMHPEMPMFLAHENPNGTYTRLAKTKFGFDTADFDPAHAAHCAGMDKGKYIFEVQVTAAAAAKLQAQNHPDVMMVIDPMPHVKHGFGARDPKELENRKHRGPKF